MKNMYSVKMEYDLFEETYRTEMFNHLDEVFNSGIRENGNTKLRNKSDILTDNQIQIIIDLLHEDYHDLGMTITIYRNRIQLYKDWLNPIKFYISKHDMKLSIKGDISGNHLEGIISIFPFNYNKKLSNYDKQLGVIYSLLHEIRHAYQRIHKKHKYYDNKRKYITANKNGYHSQWVEKDANKFATRFMNRYKDKINGILNQDVNWYCIWGNFYRVK
ncbi:DUF3920 family protein [Robertmurraya siralis]|uniref:DUF3920 family protein n=1 Tax=Robertmurraya siralis TaxID=77777 RepID=UPI0010F82E73|nr:DUF3920 family protein [Robertmurraya siralis]